MIIKYTLNDNDFTQIIEKYLEEFGPFARWVPTSEHKLVDKIILLTTKYTNHYDKYYDETLSKEELSKVKDDILQLLYTHFKAYIMSIQENSSWCTDGFDAKHLIEDRDYILENIKISLVRNIPDQYENGEMVYYTTSNIKYITM